MPIQHVLRNGLLLLAAWSNWSHAATLTVAKDNTVCPHATYTSIGAAVAAAGNGDQIEICPGLYPEQLQLTRPITLRGVNANGINRVLVQPTTMTNLGALPYQAVISAVNTKDVVIEGLAIDASQNAVTGCTTGLSVIHFYNSSGSVSRNALSGAKLSDPSSCAALFPGNGFGIEVDTAAGQTGTFSVSINGNTIHDFTRDGILAYGAGVKADIDRNTIAGAGPSAGTFQFGVFIANGAVGEVSQNMISQGNCGSIDFLDCVNVRSEGVVFRNVGDGSVVDGNIITNAQSGIFLNGANRARITNNVIMNIDALDGIDIQGTAAGHFTNSVISGNTISHVFPISSYSSINYAGCGINEYSGTGVAMNVLADNTVNDAYCGVAYVSADHVFSGMYLNTLYATLNEDLYPTVFPPAVEP